MAETLKCTSCGSIKLEQLKGELYRCRSCGATVNFLNVTDTDKVRFNLATVYRQAGDFDKARTLYREIANDNEEGLASAEARFGLFLCDYSVMFEENQATGEKFPSFYRMSDKPIDENENLKKAIELSAEFSETRDGYIEQSERIAEVLKTYRKIAAETKPWDIFISFKKSDKNGNLTKDYVLAQKLYGTLIKKYTRIFYSDTALDSLTVREYEPNIYYALYSAKAMIVICSDRENLEAQWVKNEWSRFLALNHNAALIPVFMDGCDISDLPKEIGKRQGYAVKDMDFFSRLDDTLDALVNSDERKAELAKCAEEERLKREREDAERAERFRTEAATAAREAAATAVRGISSGGGPSVATYLERAEIELSNGDYTKSFQILDSALNLDGKNSKLWWLMFLAEKKLSSEKDLPNLYETDWSEDKRFESAMKFADVGEKHFFENLIYLWIKDRIKRVAKYLKQGDFISAQKYLNLIAVKLERYGKEEVEAYNRLEREARFARNCSELLSKYGCKEVSELVGVGGLFDNENFKQLKKLASDTQGEEGEKYLSAVESLLNTAEENGKKYRENFDWARAKAEKTVAQKLELVAESEKRIAEIQSETEKIDKSKKVEDRFNRTFQIVSGIIYFPLFLLVLISAELNILVFDGIFGSYFGKDVWFFIRLVFWGVVFLAAFVGAILLHIHLDDGDLFGTKKGEKSNNDNDIWGFIILIDIPWILCVRLPYKKLYNVFIKPKIKKREEEKLSSEQELLSLNNRIKRIKDTILSDSIKGFPTTCSSAVCKTCIEKTKEYTDKVLHSDK
ncbi:MAG: TIR domain-containing protein [Clostridiales bacterium]|jgi:hypothetical protein|nr:TIR domain-containing protein [Clostridiales bacterium]